VCRSHHALSVCLVQACDPRWSPVSRIRLVTSWVFLTPNVVLSGPCRQDEDLITAVWRRWCVVGGCGGRLPLSTHALQSCVYHVVAPV